jgi:O-antigen/teichoic acid export membrane protein
MKPNRPRLLTNAIANYAGQITTLAVGILLTPFILNRMGAAMFGVWVLVVAIQGLGELFDLGVTGSVVKYVAEHRARDEIDEINKVVNSSFFLHMFIGTIAFAFTLLTAWVGLPMLQLEGNLLPVAQQALVIAGASLMLGLPLSVLSYVLTGLRAYEVSNVVNIAQTLLTASAVIVALLMGGGPVELVAINGIGLVLAHAVKWLMARRLLPGLRLSLRWPDRASLRRIGGYSAWFFLLDIGKKLFINADAVLIAAFLPVSKVTAYNIGFKPANAVAYLSGPFAAVLLPAASEMEARRDTAQLHRMLLASTRLALGLTLPAVLWLALFGRQALQVWVGPGHEDALPVLYVFLGVFLVSAAQNPASSILKGIGHVKALALAVIGEYTLNIILSLVLIPRMGVVGAALGTLFPALINDLIVVPWLTCRALKMDYARFLFGTIPGPIMAAVPTLGILWAASLWLQEASLIAIGTAGVIAVVVYGAFYFLLAATREERTLLVERVKALTKRRLPANSGGATGV